MSCILNWSACTEHAQLERTSLRVFDHHLAESFGPCIIEVSRDEATLLLPEHDRDGSPVAKVYIGIDDVDALH
jgi:hypothetical protein